MDLGDLKSNSFKSKEETNEPTKKSLPKVVTGEVKTRSRSLLGKVADILVNQDVENVKEHVVDDVIIPSIKHTVVDALVRLVELFFDTRRTKPSGEKTSYTNYYNKGSSSSSKPAASEQDRTSYGSKKKDFETVIVETRAEAEDVIDALSTAIVTYDSVSVADFHDIIGVQSYFTDNKYGWTNLAGAKVERVSGGYLIKLPPPVALE